MSMKSKRWWSDEEVGFLLDHPDLSARELAELMGRGRQSVQKKRLSLQRGQVPSVEAWTEGEDDFILSSPEMSAKQVASHLGRSLHAVQTRRSTLGRREGVQFFGSKHPGHVGKRTLLAKSCPKCDLFLPAKWFRRRVDGNWRSACLRCQPEQEHPKRERTAADDAFYQRMQQVTRERATNNGQEWTTKDHEVLSNPDLPILTKALRLGRTYAATAAQCSKNNYTSLVGLGPAELAQWVIRFDNTKESAA